MVLRSLRAAKRRWLRATSSTSRTSAWCSSAPPPSRSGSPSARSERSRSASDGGGQTEQREQRGIEKGGERLNAAAAQLEGLQRVRAVLARIAEAVDRERR